MTLGKSPADAPGEDAMLSVVLPNFNHARYLPRALDALLSQERPADEIIVVDDASSDDSLTVLKTYADRSNRIRVIAKPKNEGALLALQTGLEAAKGRYVYFAAADDHVLPGFFSTALDWLRTFPSIGLFCGDALLFDGDTGTTLGRRPVVAPAQKAACLDPKAVEAFLRKADNFILTGSAIFDRALVIEKGGFDVRAGSFADTVLSRRIALTHGLVYAPRPVAVWNVFQESFSRRTALDHETATRVLTVLPEILAGYPDIPAWYPDLFRRRWRFAAARAATEAGPASDGIIIDIAARSRLDRAVLRTLTSIPRGFATRSLILAWLTLRLRPYRLSDLGTTAFRRYRLSKRSTEPPPPGRAA